MVIAHEPEVTKSRPEDIKAIQYKTTIYRPGKLTPAGERMAIPYHIHEYDARTSRGKWTMLNGNRKTEPTSWDHIGPNHLHTGDLKHLGSWKPEGLKNHNPKVSLFYTHMNRPGYTAKTEVLFSNLESTTKTLPTGAERKELRRQADSKKSPEEKRQAANARRPPKYPVKP
ncbi:hypothetical protein IE81DRAFT_348289 [Ceraceosorus guamensis]|uniref:Uncharacterized protein n=1 Tax=Ceraceosorus guamensis TaxID=1522189 RepID=A0A316VZ02_9BASI|nr:hypothetical protein IE81DRAFT_348289 [Ceraceosorus guamensis]PWN41481.1 hypothetical protein IE81DRAFT_348289 [Ceraceosorus guamensis]